MKQTSSQTNTGRAYGASSLTIPVRKGLPSILVCTFMCLSAFVLHANVSIQIIQGVYGGSNDTLDFYLNGILVADNYAAPSATPFVDYVQSGDFNLAVRRHTDGPAAQPLSVFTVSIPDGSIAVLALMGSDPSNYTLYKELDARIQSNDTTTADIRFIHGAYDKPSLDGLSRVGSMIFGNLTYGTHTDYLSFNELEYYLDVKAHGTINLLGTFRLLLYDKQGKGFHILFTRGANNGATDLSMVLIDDQGLVTPLIWAPVSRIQLLNAMPDTIDVYKNLSRFADNAPSRSAMPFKYLPAGLNMTIGIAQATSQQWTDAVTQTNYTFQNPKRYYAIASGKLNDVSYQPTMYIFPDVLEKSDDTNMVSVSMVNTVLGGVPLSVKILQNDQTTALGFMELQPYVNLLPQTYFIEVIRTDNQTSLGQFALSLDSLAGQAILILASGDNTSGTLNDFTLWAAMPDGKTLYSSTVSSTDELANNLQVSLYPNPASTTLSTSFTLDRAQTLVFSIHDMLGRTVTAPYSVEFSSGPQLHNLNTSTLPTGTYLLRVRSNELNYTTLFATQN